VKRSIAQARSTLSPRERECLVLAFEGLTARESSQRLSCTERTVNYHLANAMGKLKVDNKMAAIQRACWIGPSERRLPAGQAVILRREGNQWTSPIATHP
jgi:DNA-binding CsgD family transcriptional regulator